jgi:hypothetical protein
VWLVDLGGDWAERGNGIKKIFENNSEWIGVSQDGIS